MLPDEFPHLQGFFGHSRGSGFNRQIIATLAE
jgi:hypothetical protein